MGDLRIDGSVLINAGAGMTRAAAAFNASERSLDSCGSPTVASSASASEQEATMTVLHLGDEAHQAGTSLQAIGAIFEATDFALGGWVRD